ncbi:MAG: CDP-alcohol phosphatidyltransferase family protein [Bacilli bacterium]|nr:CDP-alcohol phosphatidyltransferase family protein [Bacilli bacterium]
MSNEKAKAKLKKALFNPDNKLALIPNWLSFSRVIGSYAIPIMIYTGASAAAIFGTISFIGISDFLDGKIARALKIDSEEGALVDAVADKFFSINLILGILPKAPLFLINGLLESQISYVNGKAYAEGKEPKSSLLGKIKIWPLSIGLGLGYLSIAMKKQGVTAVDPNKIMLASNLFCAATIPLEIINLKEYKKEADKPKETKNNNEEKTKVKEKTKENKKEKTKTNKIILDKDANIPLMVFEPKKEEENIKGKQKRLK